MCRPEYLTLFYAIYFLCMTEGVAGRPHDMPLSDASSHDDVNLNTTPAFNEEHDVYDDTPDEWDDVTVSARQLEEDLSVNKRGLVGGNHHAEDHSSFTTSDGDGHRAVTGTPTPGHTPTGAPGSDILLASLANAREADDPKVDLEVPSETSARPALDNVTVIVQSAQIVGSEVNTETASHPSHVVREQNDMDKMTLAHVVDDTGTVSFLSRVIEGSHVLNTRPSLETNSTESLVSTNGMDAVSTHGMDAVSTHGMDTALTHGMDTALTHGMDTALTRGMDAVSTNGMDTALTHGMDAVSTHGMDTALTHGMDTALTHGMDAVSTQGMDAVSTHGMDAVSTQGMDTVSTHGMDVAGGDDISNAPSTTTTSIHRNVNIAQEAGDDRSALDHNASDVDEHDTPVTRKDVHIIKEDSDQTLPVDADSNFHADLDPTLSYNGQLTTSEIRQTNTPSSPSLVYSTATAADMQQHQQTQIAARGLEGSHMTRGDPLTQASEPEMITSPTHLTATSQVRSGVTPLQPVTDDTLNSLDSSGDVSGRTTLQDSNDVTAPDPPTHERGTTDKDVKNESDLHHDTISAVSAISAISTSAHPTVSTSTTGSGTTQTTTTPMGTRILNSQTTTTPVGTRPNTPLSSDVSLTTRQPDATLTPRSLSSTTTTTEEKYLERTSTTQSRRAPSTPTLTGLIRSTLSGGTTPSTPTLTGLIRSTLSGGTPPPSVTGRDVIIIGTSYHMTPGSPSAQTWATSRSPTMPTNDTEDDIKLMTSGSPSMSSSELVSAEHSLATPSVDGMTDDVTTWQDQRSEVTQQPENILPEGTETDNLNLTGSVHSFVELDLAMSWKRFCNSEDPIKCELVDIMSRRHTIITVDQIKVLNKEWQCSERTQEIQVHVYLMDKFNHYDKTLTQTCYLVLNETNALAEGSIIGRTLKNVRIRDPLMKPETTSPSHNEPPAIVTDPSLFSDPGVTVALVLSLVGGCCCAGLITLQVIFRRRNRERHNFNPTFNRSHSASSLDSIQLSSVTKSRPNSGLFNPGLDLTDSLQPSHPLNFMQLSNFCANEKRISEEFQQLPSRMPRLSVVPTGEEDKNRYANILPLAQTRVTLLQDGPEPRPTYINANYITGPNNEAQYYIATQAPTQTTIHDFWTMVWQQNSRAIIMLTQMEEDGQSKCASYWPELVGKSAAQKFGDFLIELKQKDVQQEYITSQLEIHHLRKIEKREVYHFWYTCWPAHGLPEPISLVKLVLDTRPKYEGSGSPLIVHCSPGTGRTGTFIALDLCMRQFEERRIVDVLKTVYLMRQERAGVIQNKEQYSLLYNAMNEYATIVVSPVVSAASSATTLHALLSS
ncbi:unnamed protein product [Lymnaea stagnalis]|uniref:protein-tyrosine-phosphatase n=1 Tax=Lymnaea stagnalis TaxID=6523 RepID=A0AAV2GYG1_LYMST